MRFSFTIPSALQAVLPRWVQREWLALGLFAVVLMLLLFTLVKQRSTLEQEQQKLAALQQKIARQVAQHSVQASSGNASGAVGGQQQAAIQDYLAGFPPERALKAVLLDMRRLSDEGALVAEQASYRLVLKQPVAELGQYEITSPVRGSYPQVKRYIQTLLNSHPTLALQEMGMQRAKITDPQVEVDLRWVYYFKIAP